MQGWIKLHRCLMEKPIWIDSTPEQKTILITLMMMANHQGKEWEWKGERYKADPGQFITSLDSIVKKCGKGISIQNVRTALLRFEKYEFLTSEPTNKNRLITIVNWGFYQGYDEELTSNLTSSQQATNKQLTTNKNERMKEEITSIRFSYSDEQLKVIDRYFEVIAETRKSKKLSDSVVRNEMEYWSKFQPELVIHSLELHIEKYPKMKESYTRGIIRNAKPDDLKKVTKIEEYQPKKKHWSQWGILVN